SGCGVGDVVATGADAGGLAAASAVAGDGVLPCTHATRNITRGTTVRDSRARTTFVAVRACACIAGRDRRTRAASCQPPTWPTHVGLDVHGRKPGSNLVSDPASSTLTQLPLLGIA